jgi:Tol biopolymer transport system component
MQARRRRLRLSTLLPVLVLATACGSSSPPPTPGLVFVSTRDGDYALFGVTAAGKHLHRLTKAKGDPATPEGLFFEVQPSWSPDRKLIAFASRRDGPSHIFVMRPDGTDTRRITNTSRDDDHPSWSPDGKRLVLAREGALFVVPLSGSPARRLAPGFGNATNPAWSPDGKLVAYDYRQPGTSVREIWVAPVDGGRPREVTHFQQVSVNPAWSPDGARIAFASNLQAGHFEIYSIPPDGKRARLETSSDTDTIDPAWSPDGKKIAFSRGGAIWTVDRAGHTKRLTSFENDSAPTWRPRPRG